MFPICKNLSCGLISQQASLSFLLHFSYTNKRSCCEFYLVLIARLGADTKLTNLCYSSGSSGNACNWSLSTIVALPHAGTLPETQQCCLVQIQWWSFNVDMKWQ